MSMRGVSGNFRNQNDINFFLFRFDYSHTVNRILLLEVDHKGSIVFYF